jgi:hypothetical protein
MQTRVKMLKVKIKSLAEEARIIRLEERRSKPGGQQQNELHAHRVRDVRNEQRHSLLAYAFIRGVALSKCEPHSDSLPDWARVAKLVEKFGVVDWSLRTAQAKMFADWKAGIEMTANSLTRSSA